MINQSTANSYNPLKTVVYLLLGVFGFLGLMSLALAFATASVLVLELAFPGNLETEVTIFTTIGALEPLESLFRLAAIVLFLVWCYVMTKNLPALGVEVPEYSPGWAVGWWFIPFLNLVAPMLVIRGLWNDSDPKTLDNDGIFAVKAGTPRLILAWWLCFVISGLLIRLLGVLVSSNRVAAGKLDEVAFFFLLQNLFTIGSVILVCKIIWGVHQRQEERHRRLSLTNESGPPPPPDSF